MLLVIICLSCLLLGYIVYSRVVERIVMPYRSETPAIHHSDGMDYVPMSKSKIHLIELLNIAGTGPIFGALMGAKWGPIVFIWIVGGTIFGGAVHDYLSGMMSVRNEGKSATFLIRHYLGERARYPLLIFLIILMVMVVATMARSASDLLVIITDIPAFFWFLLIIAYFIASTLLPINKLIGKIYPIFGVLLIAMAVIVFGGLVLGGYDMPAFTLDNLHPTGDDFFPDMFITVACGAISGFHATQAPMAARCLKDEKDARVVFYGAMLVESAIAVFWAAAGMAFFSDTSALAEALAAGGASGVVYEIATTVAGPIGGFMAVVGVIVCPITSGDTALRSARLMIQDDRGWDSSKLKSGIIIVAFMMIPVVMLLTMDFSLLWKYFSWLNQILACIILWTLTVFVVSTRKYNRYALFTAIPAVFMTMVVLAFILNAPIGFGLDHSLAIAIAAVITTVIALVFARFYLINGRAKSIECVTTR